MATMDQTSKFCKKCNAQTLHARPGTNHLVHALVTLLLCGFWLPIWILASLKIGGWKCQTCGCGGSHVVRIGLGVVCVVLFLVLLSIVASQTDHNKQTAREGSHHPQTQLQQTPQSVSQPQQQSELKHYQKIRTQGKTHFAWIDPQHKYEPNVYEQAVTEMGGDKQFCKILFWDSHSSIPKSLPMSDEQLNSQVAQYERNRATEHERFFYMQNGNMVEPFGKLPSETPIPVAKSVSEPSSKPTNNPKPDSSQPDNPQNKTEKQNYAEGENVHVGYTSYAVWRSWWSNRLSKNQFLNQRPDAMYLFVELSVRNNDKKPRMIPPFTLVDDSGAEHQASSNGWAVQGSIGLINSLNPSVNKQGFVIFDVPQGRKYRLKLSGGYWSLKDAYVQLTPKTSRDDAIRAEKDQQNAKEKAAKKRQADAKRQAAKKRRETDEAAKWRTWTNSAGTHKTEAKYGGTISGEVKLTKRDGTVVRVPLDKLSDADQQWIKDRKK